MFTTPTIRPIKPFDATVGTTVFFDVQSGPQVVKNRLTVKHTGTGTTVYQEEKDTLSYTHVISPTGEELTNGNSYLAIIEVADSVGNWSAESEALLFWVLSPPTIVFTNIDEYGKVYNQTETFSATYTQAENELLQYYKYYWYDSNQNLLESFEDVYSDGSNPLTQEIASLENSVVYFVEVKTLSQNGQEGSSGLVEFTAEYSAPRLLTTFEAENSPATGTIKLSASVLQVILHLYDPENDEIDNENIVYTNETWLDMNNANYAKLVGNEGFSILKDNFILQMWLKNLPENETFLRILGSEGNIELQYYDNRIHAFKVLNDNELMSHFASEEFVLANPDDTIMFRINHINNLMDILVNV